MENIVATLITSAVTLISVFISAKATQDKISQSLDKQISVQQNEINHIKADLNELREDIKEHNHYAKLFAETMPVVQERIKVANNRIADLEKKVE